MRVLAITHAVVSLQALPELELRHMRQMEMEMLRMLDFQVMVLDVTQWWRYHAGLVEISLRFRHVLSSFHRKHSLEHAR